MVVLLHYIYIPASGEIFLREVLGTLLRQSLDFKLKLYFLATYHSKISKTHILCGRMSLQLGARIFATSVLFILHKHSLFFHSGVTGVVLNKGVVHNVILRHLSLRFPNSSSSKLPQHGCCCFLSNLFCSWEINGGSVEWGSRNHFTWHPVTVNVMQETFF